MGGGGLIILADLTNATRRGKNHRELLINKLDGLAGPCSWVGHRHDLNTYVAYDNGERHEAFLRSAKLRWPAIRWVDLQARGLWSATPEKIASSIHRKSVHAVSFDIGYRLMCDFWVHGVWKLAAAEGLEHIVRIDTDSNLPCGERASAAGRAVKLLSLMREHNLSYGFYHRNWESPDFAIGFNAAARRHVESARLSLANTFGGYTTFGSREKGSGKIFELGRSDYEPARFFYNNVEVARVSHFQRPDVQAFTRAIRRSGGIFRHRWGDAIVRYMQVALFARPEEVRCLTSELLAYCHAGCCVGLTGDDGNEAVCCDPCLQRAIVRKQIPSWVDAEGCCLGMKESCYR